MALWGWPDFNFDTKFFLMLWFVNFLFVLRQEDMDLMILPMVFSPIQFWSTRHLVILDDLSPSGRVALCLLFPWGRLDSQSLKSWTGSVFPPSVLYISCDVVLRLIVRPPQRVLVGPSQNSANSLPSSCCHMTRSSMYASWYSWPPRKPSVKFLEFTLLNTLPLKLPSWPFCQMHVFHAKFDGKTVLNEEILANKWRKKIKHVKVGLQNWSLSYNMLKFWVRL